MTTIQSIPHAFSPASNVTVSPFQQSPNKILLRIQYEVVGRNEKTNYQTKTNLVIELKEKKFNEF